MPDSDLNSDPLLVNVPLHEGYKVLGGVVLYEKLGEGGMGAVYKGRHLRLDIDVAVKVMSRPAAMTSGQLDDFVKRFIREARTAARIDHPNLVRVLDVDTQHDVYFLVMQFVDGESAGDRLKRKGKLSEEEAVEIALGAAEGLAEAHRRSIVHRDVKPDNVMIDKEGRVRMADLGLAKAISGETDTGGPSMLTQTQTAMGTPHYMPPEQFVSARDVGPRADVWSLGVTLYQLLTGALPWSESSVFTLAVKIQTEPFTDPKKLCVGLSDGTCEVITRTLRKDPAERYSDCGQVAEVLRAHLDSIRTSAKSVLPDATAGSTKLALMTLTPPPSRTLTMIGASLLSTGGTPSRVDSARVEAPGVAGVSPATFPTVAAPRRGGAGMVLLGILLAAALGGGGFAAWYFLAGPGSRASEREHTARVGPLAPAAGSTLTAEPTGSSGRSVSSGARAAQEEARAASILKTARSLRQAGLLDKARDKAAEALEVIPDHAGARRFLTEVGAEIAAGQSEAERTAEHRKWMDEGLRLRLAGKLRGAATAYERAQASARPGSTEAAEAAAECLAEYFKAQAVDAEARGDLERAVELYATALAKRDAPETRRRLADATGKLEAKRAGEARRAEAAEYKSHAEEAERRGDLERAVELYAKAVAKRDDPEARRRLADARRRLEAKRAGEARRAEEAKYKSRAEEAERRGDLKAAVGHYREAAKHGAGVSSKIASLEREIARREGAARSQKAYDDAMSRARSLVRRRQWREAVSACEDALRRKPGDRGAAGLLAEAKRHLGSARTLTLDLGAGVTMEVVLIPAGEFMMGSPKSEASRRSDEGPRHRVRITRAFYMGKHEVTQAQYVRLMGKNPSRFKGPTNPVEMASWNDAVDFCRKLSQRTGRKARLPTEAEWEYACRAGTTTRYCSGDSEKAVGDYAWHSGNARRKPLPVGGKRANAWGLHDMHGNVWEWCSDPHDSGYYGKSPPEDPRGPKKGRFYVLRGGSYSNSHKYCRSAHRYSGRPTGRYNRNGFRVVVDAQGR